MSATQQTSSSSSIKSQRDRTEDPEKDLPEPLNNVEDPEKGNESHRILLDPADWNGADDPENPMNWSTRKRFVHMLPPAFISFAATFGTSVYAPAVQQVQQDFHVGSTVALLPLSLYVLALGFGPILAAPLSETYGRHIVYTISGPVGMLFTMGAGFSQNIWTLCILRFFAGLAFSPALSIGGGSIADVNKPEHRAAPSTLYILSPFLGPSLGPIIGSFVTVRKSWRWTQWTVIFFSIFAQLFLLFTQETYKKTIIQRRNKKLGIPPPPSPFPNAGAKIKFLLTVTLLRPLHMLVTEPIVGFLSLYVAFNFGVLYVFFAAVPYVFESVYGFDVEDSGLVFISIGVGCVLAIPSILLCNSYFYLPRVRISHDEGKLGVVAPEYRLYPAMMGTFGLPLGLFWFAWTARSDVSWASPVVALVPFAWGNMSIFVASAIYLIDTYQALTGASALAANGLLRYTFGAAFPLFTLQMYERLGIDWATSLLGFLTIALMPIPWVLFKFGHSIRGRSHYDTLKV